MLSHTDPSLAGSRARWRVLLQNTGDRILDRVLGVETAEWVGHQGLEFDASVGSHYQPSNWFNLILLYRMMRQLRITSKNVFVDFGCGKGVVLLLAARFPFARVIGVDLSARMLEVARRNIDKRASDSGRRPFELVQADAATYPIPTDVDTCYFYRPFPPGVHEAVIANLEASAVAHPREIRLLFLSAVPESAAVPARHGFHEVRRMRHLVLYSNALDPSVAPATER
jgi:SAM-dependent methyltransferase